MQLRNLLPTPVHHVESSSRAFCLFLKTLLLALLFGVVLFSSTAIAETYPEQPAGRRIHFVKKAATGNNNGSTWEHAFNYLQDALAVTKSGDEIWIAQGTYYPDEGANETKGNPNAKFYLIPGVKLVGGFSGEKGEYLPNHRLYPTIISGDLERNDVDNQQLNDPSRIDNSYRLFYVVANSVCSGMEECAFYLEGLNMEATSGPAGAAVSVLALQNLKNVTLSLVDSEIRNNFSLDRFPALYVSGTSLRLVRVHVHNNVTAALGIVGISESSASIVRSRFSNNRAAGGSGLAVDFSRVSISETEFSNNHASISSGAIYSRVSSLYIESSTFVGNTAFSAAGAIGFDREGDSPHIIVNSIFVGNRVEATYTDIPQGGAIIAGANGNYLFINCTFTQNTSHSDGSAISVYAGAKLRLLNSIIWNNRDTVGNPQVANFWIPRTDNIYAADNILEGGIPDYFIDGGNNMDVDPLFVDEFGPDGIAGTGDEDVRLQRLSPAVDNGNIHHMLSDSLDIDQDGNSNEKTPYDLAGNPRVIGANIDMGALEYGLHPRQAADDFRVEVDTFPNPADEEVNISILLNGRLHVKVDVFDMFGRRVAEEFFSLNSSGKSIIRISTAPFASGLYLIVIFGHDFAISKSVVIVH